MPGSSGIRILVVGGGGREHAIVWSLARSVHRPTISCAPGNPGIAALARCVPISADDLDGLIRFIRSEGITLTVVGPEKPLALGLADRLRAIRCPVVGPSAAAARIESSKSFAKEVMARAKIPTASAEVFEETGRAIEYVRSRPLPLVIKADGLAQGKGVVIAHSLDDATRTIEHFMTRGALGEAGRRVLIEQFLTGEEVTCMAVTDGRTVVPLAAAQDHKQLLDGGRGPNTGGMGAYAPVPFVPPALLARVTREVFHPLLDELNRMGIEYQGVLYAGLMLCRDGPSVLEFNCRFGDPEAQAVLPLLASDAVDLFDALAHARLTAGHVRWREGSGVCVVLASEGYPDSPVTGRPVTGADEAAAIDGVQLFHAGTAIKQGMLVTQGGRVFGVAAQAATLQAAREQAYRVVDLVQFDGKQFRRDIGAHAAQVAGGDDH
ncbi:MAG TPA: phosphoribosylamine--glycine ligase [Nitrospiria bacterium]|nr:phosphoribosylamine--glycine ligase [Nitrospiria bacterium]